MDDVQTLAQQATDDAAGVLAWLRSQCPVITDSAQAQWAADSIHQIAAQRVAVERQRKDIKGPIIEAGRRVDALFRPAVQTYEKAERWLKDRIQEYRDAERGRQEAALREATTREEITRAVAAAPAPVGIVERTVIRGKVVDRELLPRQYWAVLIDQDKIDRDIRAGHTIPGVEIVRETRIIRKARANR